MSAPITSNVVNSMRIRRLFAAGLVALLGIWSTGVSAAAQSQSWSVFVHIAYPDGFVYENAFAVGVSTEDLPSLLSACGSAHMGGSGVRYHCFAALER
jgi:hypothetical protein